MEPEKNDIFGDILRSIFTFWNNPNLEEFTEKAKSFKDLSLVSLGKCNEVSIYLVNGDIVKTRHFEDFVEGGNDAVYGSKAGEVAKFMPDNQVWIDANIDINSLPYICFHELWERDQMISNNLHYEQAHEKADDLEMKLRKIKAFEKRRNILKFPRIEQPDSSTCGHTCLAMILQYYGIYKTVEDIKNIVDQKENEDGLSTETIIKLASDFKLKAYTKMALSFDEIKSYIDQDTPVILEIQFSSDVPPDFDWSDKYDDGHYVVAIGYTLEHVIIANPCVFYKTFIKFEDLLSRWHNFVDERKTDKLAIIVEKPNNKSFEREKAIPLQ
jgi:hypothetical protein